MDLDLRVRFDKIKLLAMDFDGVMTDGYVYLDQYGKETVRCSRKDGLGIEMLKKAGVKLAVISKEFNPVVSKRCEKLKIPCWQRIEKTGGKLEILKKILEDDKLSPDEVAYLGDDLNDMAVLEYVGVAVTVADGHPKVKAVADYVTLAKGGEHAVREAAEAILEAKGIELKF